MRARVGSRFCGYAVGMTRARFGSLVLATLAGVAAACGAFSGADVTSPDEAGAGDALAGDATGSTGDEGEGNVDAAQSGDAGASGKDAADGAPAIS